MFHPLQILRSLHKPEKVLGWQYEMIYLGGDPYNPKQAVVNVRTLNRAVVIRASDGKEEAFHSILVPYARIADVRLVEAENGREVAIGEKRFMGEVFEKVLLIYDDNGVDRTLELRMSMAADIYRNSKLCRNMQEYVASKLKKIP